MDTNTLVQATNDQLRAEMAANGVSGKDLAERTGISYPTLIRYIRGERPTPLAALVEMLSALGVDPATFLQRAAERAEK